MSTKNYNCTQHELYAVCTLAWESCSKNLEAFTAYKPIYTVAFIEERKKELNSISKMYDRYQRSAATELKRQALKSQLISSLDAWKKLKITLAGCYPPWNTS